MLYLFGINSNQSIGFPACFWVRHHNSNFLKQDRISPVHIRQHVEADFRPSCKNVDFLSHQLTEGSCTCSVNDLSHSHYILRWTDFVSFIDSNYESLFFILYKKIQTVNLREIKCAGHDVQYSLLQTAAIVNYSTRKLRQRQLRNLNR